MKKNRSLASIMAHLLCAGILLAMTSPVFAQDADEPLAMDFNLKYTKQANGIIALKAHAEASNEEGYFAVTGIPVSFYMATDSVPYLIGMVNTDAEGNAIVQIDNSITLFRNDEAYIQFTAEFEGNEQFEAAYAEVSVRELTLTMTLDELDGERKALIEAYWIDKDGIPVPVTEEDVFLYVKGLFSYLQIADGYLEDGSCEITFPADIPGNREGIVGIYARFVDHDDYGTVEVFETRPWGVIPHYLANDDGKLWTSMAPTWMIVVLIILLSGVWGHYIYAVIQMVAISRAGSTNGKQTK